jgi:hypothetical protein
MAQVRGGIHHREVAAVAALDPGAPGYFDEDRWGYLVWHIFSLRPRRPMAA